MSRHEPIAHGTPGHFIGWSSCCFRLHHEVGGVRVSTVGCYHPSRSGDETPHEIGLGRTYETFVFPLDGSTDPFGLRGISAGEIDSQGYNDQAAAEVGHAAMVEKWADAEYQSAQLTEAARMILACEMEARRA